MLRVLINSSKEQLSASIVDAGQVKNREIAITLTNIKAYANITTDGKK